MQVIIKNGLRKQIWNVIRNKGPSTNKNMPKSETLSHLGGGGGGPGDKALSHFFYMKFLKFQN